MDGCGCVWTRPPAREDIFHFWIIAFRLRRAQYLSETYFVYSPSSCYHHHHHGSSWLCFVGPVAVSRSVVSYCSVSSVGWAGLTVKIHIVCSLWFSSFEDSLFAHVRICFFGWLVTMQCWRADLRYDVLPQGRGSGRDLLFYHSRCADASGCG